MLLLHLAEGRHLAVPFPARGERVPENARNRFHLRDHLRGEMVLAKGLVLLQEHDPLDQVPELPDVPGPPVAAQDLLHLRRDRGEPLPEFLVVELEEVPGQEQDVFSPFPKRWQENGDDLEPVVEVLPEAALLHGQVQIPIRGGDDPDVHLEVRGAAHPLERPVLDEAEEFGLSRGGKVGDLVQEQRALVRQLHQPALGLARVREGASLVPEELVFQELLLEGGAVERQEG